MMGNGRISIESGEHHCLLGKTIVRGDGAAIHAAGVLRSWAVVLKTCGYKKLRGCERWLLGSIRSDVHIQG